MKNPIIYPLLKIKMLSILTGIPGTGKTTIAKKALEILEKEGIFYKFINFGDIMFEIAKDKNLVSNRDEMRKLKPEKQKEIQILTAKKISKMTREENVLLDTHCTISTPRGFLPGIPEYVLRELEPDLLILIEAREEEIYQRREKDESRQRDEELLDKIGLHQELNRGIAMTYSTLTGATVKIIQNPQGRIDESANEVVKILK